MLSLIKNARIKRCLAAVAAGTTEQTGTSVKLDSGESVTFIASFGTLSSGAVTGLKAQGTRDGTNWFDLEGTAVAIPQATGSGRCLVLEIVRSMDLEVRPVVTRGTGNAVIDGVVAIVTNPRKAPVVHDATVEAFKSVVSPVEGTA